MVHRTPGSETSWLITVCHQDLEEDEEGGEDAGVEQLHPPVIHHPGAHQPEYSCLHHHEHHGDEDDDHDVGDTDHDELFSSDSCLLPSLPPPPSSPSDLILSAQSCHSTRESILEEVLSWRRTPPSDSDHRTKHPVIPRPNHHEKRFLFHPKHCLSSLYSLRYILLLLFLGRRTIIRPSVAIFSIL